MHSQEKTRVNTASWLPLAALLALVTLAWCTGTGRWTAAAWNTPSQYLDGFYCDVMSTFAGMRATADGHCWPFAWKTIPELGAPFDGNWNDWPSIEEVQSLFYGLLGRAFGLFAGLNIALLVGHLLAAATMFLVARSLDCSTPWALVAGLAFGLAPYIFAQSPHHITVAYAWHVPLFMLVWKWASVEPGLEFGSRKFWSAACIAFITGLQNVYYTNIFCQLTLLGAGLANSGKMIWGRCRSKRRSSRSRTEALPRSTSTATASPTRASSSSTNSAAWASTSRRSKAQPATSSASRWHGESGVPGKMKSCPHGRTRLTALP